jgi:predicted RNase H-like HicB family nuclease
VKVSEVIYDPKANIHSRDSKPERSEWSEWRAARLFCYNESRERQAEMKLTVEYEQEADGRWLAEVKESPGVLAYGKDSDDVADRAQALALRVIEDRLENREGLSS